MMPAFKVPLEKRRMVAWGVMRARALRRLRPVWRGTRVLWHAQGRVELDPFEILGPGPGEILVRAAMTAISPGTERAQYNRLPNTVVSYPHVPGYSGVGRVVAAGPGTPGLRPGDRVAGPMPHASMAVLTASRCLKVPEEVADEGAAFVSLGMIAIQGVHKAGIRWGDDVAVLGRGLLGRLVARVATLAGARVVLCGRTPSAPGSAPLGACLGDLVRSSTRFGTVLEATGNPDAVVDAAGIVEPGGRLVLIGSARGASPALPRDAVEAGIEILGAHATMLPASDSAPGRRTLAQEGELFLDWLRSGALELPGSLEAFAPAEAWHVYRRLARARPAIVAAVFDWRRSDSRLACRRSTLALPERILRRAIQPRPPAGHRAPAWPRRAATREDRAMKAERGHAPSGPALGAVMIGCGEIAVRNARNAAAGGVRILWAVDTNPDLARDLAGRFGARHGTDTAAALADPDVSVAFVCVPHHLHAPIALQAARAGKHVLVEKPTARTAAEAGTMFETARACGVRLATCYPMRRLPQVRAARRLIEEGALGRILGARIAEHLYKEMAYWNGGATGRARSGWRARRETSGGGVLMTNLCHHLDVLFHVTGLTPRSVSCDVERFDAPGDVEDALVMSLRLENGALVSIEATTCAPGAAESSFRLWGTDGQIALDVPPRALVLRENSLLRPGDWTRLPVGSEDAARRDFVTAFAAAISGGGADPHPADEALLVQRVIDCAYASADRGAVVAIPAATVPVADAAAQP